MDSELTNVINVAENYVLECTNFVHVVKVVMPANLFDKICQTIIAIAAVVGPIIMFFQVRINKRIMAPKLDLKLIVKKPIRKLKDPASGADADMEISRKLELIVELENIGPEIAKHCKVFSDRPHIIQDSVEEPLDDEAQRELLQKDNTGDCAGAELQSGAKVQYEIGDIGLGMAAGKVAEGGVEGGDDDATVNLKYKGGLTDSLLRHQSHMKQILTLTADNMSPQKYVMEINWKGTKLSDIGTPGSFVGTLTPKK